MYVTNSLVSTVWTVWKARLIPQTEALLSTPSSRLFIRCILNWIYLCQSLPHYCRRGALNECITPAKKSVTDSNTTHNMLSSHSRCKAANNLKHLHRSVSPCYDQVSLYCRDERQRGLSLFVGRFATRFGIVVRQISTQWTHFSPDTHTHSLSPVHFSTTTYLTSIIL